MASLIQSLIPDIAKCAYAKAVHWGWEPSTSLQTILRIFVQTSSDWCFSNVNYTQKSNAFYWVKAYLLSINKMWHNRMGKQSRKHKIIRWVFMCLGITPHSLADLGMDEHHLPMKTEHTVQFVEKSWAEGGSLLHLKYLPPKQKRSRKCSTFSPANTNSSFSQQQERMCSSSQSPMPSARVCAVTSSKNDLGKTWQARWQQSQVKMLTRKYSNR